MSVLDILEALGRGGAQGLGLGFADEIFGPEEYEAARSSNPVSYSVGNALGALPYAALGARIGGSRTSALAKLLTSAGLGAIHGGVAGAGGLTPGDLSTEERIKESLLMAMVGAGVGGLAVPVTRAGLDAADNVPAIMGRRRTEDGVVQAGLGQGTRASAPLQVRLAGEGDSAARAEAALRGGLGMDEYDIMRRGEAGRFNRYGEKFTPFDSAQGRSTRSLVDYAAQSPAGRTKLEDDAAMISRGAAEAQLKASSLPKGRAKVDLKDERLMAMLETLDEPNFHRAWVQEARRLNPTQKKKLARAIALQVREEVQSGDAQMAQARVNDTALREKLDALGIDMPRRGSAQERSATARAQALRDRSAFREDPLYADGERGFANIEDRLLSRQGPLSEEDAIALLEAAMRERGGFYNRPVNPADARLLRGEYEQGVRFNPKSWVGGDEEKINIAGFELTPTELAILASQPAAALAHGAPSWFEDR